MRTATIYLLLLNFDAIGVTWTANIIVSVNKNAISGYLFAYVNFLQARQKHTCHKRYCFYKSLLPFWLLQQNRT